jgi:hypothetical protein
LNITAKWEKEDESRNVSSAIGALISQAKKAENSKLRTFAKGLDAVKKIAEGDTGLEGIMADYTGLRHDIAGPATKKNYGKPAMGNISFDCTYDLRAGQRKFADISIRTILGMVYPGSGKTKIGTVYDGTVRDAKDENDKNILVKVIGGFRGTFGMIRTYNPLPVEAVLGQHFYMAPMVINDVKITSSADYFAEGELMHPAWIKVHIELEPYLMPNPAQSWLVYSGYNLMGPDAGKPYEAGPDAI